MVKIAIDAGHGLYTAGKRCMKSIDSKETREWVLNDRIADKLEKLLKGYNCQVIRTDDTTGKKDIALEERVKKANDFDADIFISIHHNAGLNGAKGGGTQVYHYASLNKTVEAGKRLYEAIVKSTGLRGNRAETVLKYPFYVCKYTKMRAYLIENGFMDSPDDVPIILSEAHAEKTAKGIFNFLVKEYDLTKSGAGGSVVTEAGKVLYKVQCGAFTNKVYAENLKKKLEKAGFEAFVVVEKNG